MPVRISDICFSYEIADGGADWEDAERQIRAAHVDGSKSLTVSVKTGKPAKRKAGEAVEEAYREDILAKEGKKTKKAGKRSR